MQTPTLEDVQQFIKTHELKPGSVHVLTFDVNTVTYRNIREIADALFRQHGIELYMLGYDAMTNEQPIQLFEVKRDADQP